jgi:peptide/nickel transport system substrate-binding protein
MTSLTRRHLLSTSTLAALTPLLPQGAMAQTPAPKKGGVLTSLLTPEPPILVLGVNNQGPTGIVASKIYESLLEYSPKLEPLPRLAKSWQLSDDKKTYTFHLQPNVKFHDGTPMTARDVIFSVMQFHMKLAPRARGVFSKITSATAPDDQTVQFVLDAPFEPFLLMFDVSTVAIVPSHIYEGTDFVNNPANQTPIGTGPFKFAEWQRGNFIRLTRFEDYWKPGQPYLDGITYRIVPDSQSRALALQTGQVLMSGSNDIEPFDVPRFQSQPNLQVEATGWEYFSPLMWVELNHRTKPLDDVRVRNALSMALDRDFIVKRLWFGIGKVATGPVSSTTRFHNPDLKPLPFDVAKANALLDEAGLKPGPDGVRFRLKHLSLPYGEVYARMAEYIRASWKKVGVEVTLESTDTGGWARRLSDWDYDTTINFVYQFGDPTLGVERTYVSSNIKKIVFTNTSGFSNPEVDRLFAIARTAADTEERQKALYAVQELLVQQMPEIWLMEMSFPTIHDRKVNNLITSGTGIVSSFDNVWIG